MKLHSRSVRPHPSLQAFTLVELAIVVAIVGLLVGGLLIGQSLLQKGNLQKTVRDLTTYKSAMLQFKKQYIQLPGDMSDAEDFWGTDSDCVLGDLTPKKETCNGDGSGGIGTAGADSSESLRAWQQLANAGLISGLYSGGASDGTYTGDPEVNVPKGAMKSSLPYVKLEGPYTGNADAMYFDMPATNILIYGANRSTGGPPTAGIFPIADMASMDLKIDDGEVAFGNYRAVKGSGSCSAVTGGFNRYSTTSNALCAILYFVEPYYATN